MNTYMPLYNCSDYVACNEHRNIFSFYKPKSSIRDAKGNMKF